LNAAVSKTVVRLIGVPRVRISPPPFLVCMTSLLELWLSGMSQSVDHARRVSDAVNSPLATEAALDKLGARGISVVEAAVEKFAHTIFSGVETDATVARPDV
jgi:hypothetical protein